MSDKTTLAKASDMNTPTINEAGNVLCPWWGGVGCKLTWQRLWIGEEWRIPNTIAIHYSWAVEHLEKNAVEKENREIWWSIPFAQLRLLIILSLAGRRRAMTDGLTSPFGVALNYLYSFVKTGFLPSFHTVSCLMLWSSSNWLLRGF